MNILILSAGTRNKVVQFFKRTVADGGKVVATDMQATAPAGYEADAFYLVPPITAPDYINKVLEICKKEQIQAVLSLIDPELGLLAKHKAEFEAIGVTVIGSSEALCERALNKMQMFHWLVEHGYRCARSYDNTKDFYADLSAGKISFPVFVKPILGSASTCVNKVCDKETVELLFAHCGDLMIQEFLDGQEIGADVYADLLSHEAVSVFTKKKLLMRAGETDKAVSFKDEKLFDLIDRFVAESGWTGPIDVDLFEVDGEYYISEVNPRFGGGYPHAYACGVDFMQLIKNNIDGNANEKNIGAYESGVYMMKYNEIRVEKDLCFLSDMR